MCVWTAIEISVAPGTPTSIKEFRRVSLTGWHGGEMPENSILPDIYNFLLGHIDSIGAIEALLLLCRNQDQPWTPAEVGKRLYISEVEAQELLDQLHDDGLIQGEGGAFRFRPANPDQEELMKRVADTYQSQLITVTKIIHSKPRRIREFANAFKLRKDRG
jgi:hypothetical protein